jgi:hypothetical protein
VQDIVAGAEGSHPRELAVVGNRLYFSADDGMHGQEPWSLPLPPMAATDEQGRGAQEQRSASDGAS